jgi:hypothetical protein
MKALHTFAKYLFDLALTVFWIYVPLFHFNLKDAPYSVAIWTVDLITLSVIIYLLHRKGGHSLYSS